MKRPVRYLVTLAVLYAFTCTASAGAQVRVLHHGHSHNDYRQKRPLHDALDLGFASVEVDVFSYKGAIKVSHVHSRLGRKPDLESLYLQPLARRIEANGGTVFPGDSTPLVLMIDLKRDKQALIELLTVALEPYRHLIQPRGDATDWAPVRIVLSGGPPRDAVLSNPHGLLRLDGYAGNSYSVPADDMPRVSAAYGTYLSWKGKGEMPFAERARLRDLTAQARREGRRLRFWASPHREAVWTALLDEGVGWINVDDLERFRRFYLDYRVEP